MSSTIYPGSLPLNLWAHRKGPNSRQTAGYVRRVSVLLGMCSLHRIAVLQEAANHLIGFLYDKWQLFGESIKPDRVVHSGKLCLVDACI